MEIDVAQVYSTYGVSDAVYKTYDDEFVNVLYKEFKVDGDLPFVDCTNGGIYKDLIQKYVTNREFTQSAIMTLWHQVEDSLEEHNNKSTDLDKAKTIDLVKKLKHLEDSCITNECISTSIVNKKDLVLFSPNADIYEAEEPKEDYCQLEQQVLWRRIVDILNYNDKINDDANNLSFPSNNKAMEEYNNSNIITYLKGILNLKQLSSDIQSQDDNMHNIDECNYQSKMKK